MNALDQVKILRSDVISWIVYDIITNIFESHTHGSKESFKEKLERSKTYLIPIKVTPETRLGTKNTK